MKTAENALIIFTKNMVYGKVKTRLAATIGHDQAFAIYKKLVAHTQRIAHSLQLHKIVYYSDFIENNDLWNDYTKAKQQGHDLGQRMHHAFEDCFTKGFKKVVIIGTDCFELTEAIINQAYTELDRHEIVIGPALDGGYYLLGTKKLTPQLFQNIAWSTEHVYAATEAICRQNNLSCFLLPPLSDVDEEKDLPRKFSLYD